MIRGRSYSDSGYVDAESSRGVTLGFLGLRVGERFCWRYDFYSGLVIDVRVEALVDVGAVSVVSGRQVGPPEWVGGPERFVEWEEVHRMDARSWAVCSVFMFTRLDAVRFQHR